MKKLYSENNKFKTWVRMLMCLPFLNLKSYEDEDHIDVCWTELKDDLCDLDETDNKKRDQLIEYFGSTWIGPNATFPREIWNLYDNISHRTNNISETYNKKLNKEISKPDPNIYKLVDIIKEQEVLTSVSYEKANLGHKKSRRTKEDLKDKEIEILKIKYNTKQIELMEYLLALSEYVQDFN
jgi:hypothetical protein